MPISFRRSVLAATSLLVPVLLLCLFSLTAAQAIAQEAIPPTPFQKQMDRIDMAFGVTGIFSSSVSGTEQRDANSTHNVLAISPSSTLGELFTIRYVARPLLGYEFNFGSSRSTQNYTFTPPLTSSILRSAQTGVRELTLGYVAHTPKLFGVQPYLGAGGGTIRFKPTPGGGEGLPFSTALPITTASASRTPFPPATSAPAWAFASSSISRPTSSRITSPSPAVRAPASPPSASTAASDGLTPVVSDRPRA